MTKAEYIELKVSQLFDFYLEDRRVLNREAHVTFTVIAAVFSACFGYLVNLYDIQQRLSDQRWAWIFPIICLLIHLGILAGLLVFRTLTVKDIEAKGNLPSNFLLPQNAECSLDELMILDCKGMEERALRLRDQNLAIARALNTVRKGLLLAPLTWMVALAAALLA